MSNSRFTGFMRLAMWTSALCMAWVASPVNAATSFQHFFPIDNDPFNTIDDEIEVRTIFWSSAMQPVEWVLIKPNGGTVLLPTLNLNFVTDAQVLEATQRSLREWNNNELSSFRFEDDVFFSSGPGSSAVPDPKPIDGIFDGHNAITFQSTVFQFDTGTIAICSSFFLEDDIELEEFEGIPIDEIEGDVIFPVDLDLDGFADIFLPARNYERGELIETDVLFNPAFTFFDWPVDQDDIDPLDLPLLPNSIDIQAILTHELGHALAVGHTWLEDPTMTPIYGSLNFPANPYEKRTLEYDDKLGGGLVYPDFDSGGEIRGWLIDGQSAEIYKALVEAAKPDPLDLETVPPALMEALFVVSQPVFVGHLAPPGLHPDNVPSEEGVTRMIAQVLTGQTLRYPAATGGALMFDLGTGVPIEPGIAIEVNIDFTEVGEDVNQNGILDFGEDINVNGVLDESTRDIDSKFRFAGLPPREDYVVYIDQNFQGLGGIAISNVNLFLAAFEVFPAEFYGGTGIFSEFIDDNSGDNVLVPEFLSVADGTVHDIVIITNTDDVPDPDQPEEGDAVGVLRFVEDHDSFTSSTYVAQGADMGDINGDGYLDVAIAVFTGGEDVGGGAFNRILLNVPQEVGNPASARRFQDITFGPDGIPGTSDDVLPAHNDNSRDAKFGDFNNDGRLDLFISNAADQNGRILDRRDQILGDEPGGGFPRLYLNEEFPGNPWGFRFRDISESTLPGLLNRGYDPTTPFSDAIGLFSDGRSDGFRASPGDIDGDGDLDIIVSLFTPGDDTTAWDLAGNPMDPTQAMIDTKPNDDEDPDGDFMLTLVSDGDVEADLVTESSPLNRFASSDLYSSGGLTFRAGNLVFTEQVLINKLIDPVAPGFYFTDETLGADNRFGDSTETFTDGMGNSHGYLGDDGVYSYGPNADRMPPVFPPLFNLKEEEGLIIKDVLQDSPQGYRGVEPRLGPVLQHATMDLISARAFTDVPTDGAENMGEQAIFKNLDTNSDGIPDGYFANVNYGLDFLDGRPASGLYPLRRLDGGSTVTLEVQPLLIGIPDGLEGDVEGDVNPERNFFTALNRPGFTSAIADWEYRGAPKPLFVPDTQLGAPFVFKPRDLAFLFTLDLGARRGQDGRVAGISPFYITIPTFGLFDDISLFFDNHASDGAPIIAASDIPVISGEPHGSTVADFDNDGDFDIVFANSVVNGFLPDGSVIAVDAPATDNIFVNNGFATFTNVTQPAFPDPANLLNRLPNVSYVPLSGDVDKDGDEDVVFINALASHDLFVNQVYDLAKPPVIASEKDPTLFHDSTPSFIPPVYDGTINPPFAAGIFAGITTTIASGDFNTDGLPDMALAEGGIFSQGDFPQVQMNVGPDRQSAGRPFNQGWQHLIPAGAANPAPRVLPNGFLNETNGYLAAGGEGAYYGVLTGDFSGDGAADLFFSRNGDGPVTLLNLDGSFAAAIFGIPETNVNRSPDLDIDPDGIFLNVGDDSLAGLGLPTLLPPLADPCPDPSGSVVLKDFGRRSTAADFNDDDTLDVFICNGLLNSGAPNVLLLNHPIQLFPYPIPIQRFTDVTETNLPTVLGDCGVPVGIYDDSYHAAAADFDHDGDVDIIVANRTDTSLGGTFPGFRFLKNDGTAVFTDTNLVDGNLPEFLDTAPRYIAIGDYDGVGEPSEDVNGNGFLDPGEDKNGNDAIDFTDLPDETAAGDVNGDGIITKRTPGVWEPSFDLFITFADQPEALLINDPTNATPGVFSDESVLRLPPFPFDGSYLVQSNGARAGDVDNDGDLDIVVAKMTINSFSRPARLFLNDGTGIFTDNSHEFPFPKSVAAFNESFGAVSFTGNANDVELVDIDLDGDLDVYVGMAGRSESLLVMGADNVFYVNRLIGDDYNATAPVLEEIMPPAPVVAPPVIFAADPNGGYQGTPALDVDVIGSRFEFSPNTTFNFGAGITVNNVTYVNPNLMKVNVNIDPAASVGPRAVDVQNPSSGLGSTASKGTFNVLDIEDNGAGSWSDYD